MEKILIIIPSVKGGAEKVSILAAKTLRNYQVFLFVLKASAAEINGLGLNSITVLYKTDTKSGMLALIKFIFKNKFYITFASNINYNGILSLLRKIKVLRTQKFIVRESTEIFKRFKGLKLLRYKLIYKFLYCSIDKVICQTDSMQFSILTNTNIPQSKTKVVLNPMEIVHFELLESKHKINKKIYVTAGRFIPEKGHINLIKAFAQLGLENSELHIYGDGPLKNIYLLEIDKLNMQNIIFVKNFSSNLNSIFSNAYCCIVSSIQEGFPNILLEMMNFNGNVISTICAGNIDKIPNLLTCKANSITGLEKVLKNAHESLPNEIEINKITFQEYLKKHDPNTFVKHVFEEN